MSTPELSDRNTLLHKTYYFSERLQEILDYYAVQSGVMLDENKAVSGMVVTAGERILCMDIYCSADLFEKMLPTLIKSAALEVCKAEKKASDYTKNDIEAFVSAVRQVRGWRKYVPQIYRYISPKLVGGATMAGEQVVHVEMYPRK